MIETGTPSSHAAPYFISVISLGIFPQQLAFHAIAAEAVSPLLWTTVEVVMRAFNQQLGSSSMALVTASVDFAATLKQMMSRMRKKTRQILCTVVHGGHELYRARTDTKLFQQCLLCGYETHGWT